MADLVHFHLEIVGVEILKKCLENRDNERAAAQYGCSKGYEILGIAVGKNARCLSRHD